MKKDIALVLSGGGARGIAHIGAIKVLQENGFNITSVAGTSMGALVGGIFSTGNLEKLEEWLTSIDLMEIIKLTDISISKRGLISGNRIIKKMKEIIPDRNIEDLPIPYCAVAVDIEDGSEKVFDKGDLYDAIRASISIPTVFKPIRIDGRYYVDGGVLNPLPVEHVKRSDKDSLVVVNVNAIIPDKKKAPETENEEIHVLGKYIKTLQQKLENLIPKNKNDDIGMFNLTNKSIGLMLDKITSLSIKAHNPDLIISMSREAYGTFDFYKAAELIERGEEEARKALKLK